MNPLLAAYRDSRYPSALDALLDLWNYVAPGSVIGWRYWIVSAAISGSHQAAAFACGFDYPLRPSAEQRAEAEMLLDARLAQIDAWACGADVESVESIHADIVAAWEGGEAI